MEEITLMLVDDHDVVRTGLRSYLETQPRMRVVAEARNGIEALQALRDVRPQIVLMDITMPGMDGLEATRRLKAEAPECLVLALTVHEDKQYFMEMLAAGASGYLTKQAAADELVAAIHAVAEGHIYLQPALARWLLEDYQRLARQVGIQPRAQEETAGHGAIGLDVLSARERQVLELVAQGRSNLEIGARLNLSHKTIARHRERIMSKLNMHSRTELVRFAIRSGLAALE
ncbi:MAG: response regulator [Chloroflexota bacterium]|jgi:two-component system response regulator NreC